MPEAAKVEIPHLESVDMITKLPVVEHVWNQTTDLYEKVKLSNKMVGWTLSTAESTLEKALQQAAPIAQKLEQPIRAVDGVLCKGITAVEDKVPLVKQQPNEIYDVAKSTIQPTIEKFSVVRQLSTEKVIAARDYGWNKANEYLSTEYGQMAVSTLDATAFIAHQFLDYYLPPSKDDDAQQPQEEESVKKPVESDQVAHTVEVVGKLSNKIRRRVYAALTLQMRGLKKQSDETISSLTSVMDILAKFNVDPKLLSDKVSALWVELNKEEGNEEAATLEQKSLFVARKLTKGVLNFCNQAQSNLNMLPSHLKSQIDVAAEYARNLYTSLKGSNYQELSETLVFQLKNQASRIQSIVKDVNSFAVQCLETLVAKANAWVEPDPSSENKTHKTPVQCAIANEPAVPKVKKAKITTEPKKEVSPDLPVASQESSSETIPKEIDSEKVSKKDV